MTETMQAALTPRARPAVPGALSASLTFGWRAMLKIKHVPQQLFDVTAFPIMFTLLFTYLFGGALEGSTSKYAQFAIPGILVQTVAFITMYTGVALNTDISKGSLRPLPVATDLADVRPGRRPLRRPRALHVRGDGGLRARASRWASGPTMSSACCSRSFCCWCSRSA